MELSQVNQKLKQLVAEEHYGVLSYRDTQNQLRACWMSPVFIRDSAALYAVSSREFNKVAAIAQNSQVHWLFQDRMLSHVIGVSGRSLIIDNPSLKAQVIEAIGPHLSVFWGRMENTDDLVVIETVLELYEYQDTQNKNRWVFNVK